MVRGCFECNGLVMFGRWVVWVALGWWYFWFTVVPRTGLVESKGLGWYWVGLGNK